LPRDIQKSIVLLLDATLATGAAAMMAIRVLLDHHVEENNIILVSLLTTQQGLFNFNLILVNYFIFNF
jgi:uridine kinase